MARTRCWLAVRSKSFIRTNVRTSSNDCKRRICRVADQFEIRSLGRSAEGAKSKGRQRFDFARYGSAAYPELVEGLDANGWHRTAHASYRIDQPAGSTTRRSPKMPLRWRFRYTWTQGIGRWSC